MSVCVNVCTFWSPLKIAQSLSHDVCSGSDTSDLEVTGVRSIVEGFMTKSALEISKYMFTMLSNGRLRTWKIVPLQYIVTVA